MSGPITPYVSFVGTNDTGTNNATSISPIADGQPVNAATSARPDENLRLRSEVLRGLATDNLYLQNADRVLIISGPGKITWDNSTTNSGSGIPVLSDNLWLVPMLTPGFAQAPPLPPVASVFGTLSLQRADSTPSILVTSSRRSYAGGDQINITVTTGLSFSCTLDTSDAGLQRTISIVAISGTTTLSTVITALNALAPSTSGDTATLVVAALEGGASGSDILKTPQTIQYIAGNYDGEGHAITPANVAGFFSGNPSSALAEGDTLCVKYADLFDTGSTGGRRQSIPENSNTAIPSGSYFNSRVHPELLVNALPVCKVINGSLVFGTGAEVPPGSSSVGFASADTGTRIVRNDSFEMGVTNDTTRFGVTDWENRADLAINGVWELHDQGAGLGKILRLFKTATSATTVRLEQVQELPVTPSVTTVRIIASLQQLIAPTAGTYSAILYWGDNDSAASGSTTVALQVLNTTDGSARVVDQTITVPSGKRFLKLVTVEAAGVTAASSGAALNVFSLQAIVSTQANHANTSHLSPAIHDAVVFEDPNTYSLGQLAALMHFDRTTPTNEGTLTLERRDETYGTNLPPSFSVVGRLLNMGKQLLTNSADALKARFQASGSAAASVTYTLIMESGLDGTAVSDGVYSDPATRVYIVSNANATSFVITSNARWDNTVWNKDKTTKPAAQVVIGSVGLFANFHSDVTSATWSDSGWDKLPLQVIYNNGFSHDVITSDCDIQAKDFDVTPLSGKYLHANKTVCAGFSRNSVIDISGGTVSSTIGTAGILQSTTITAYYTIPQPAKDEILQELDVYCANVSSGTTMSLVTFTFGGGVSYSAVSGATNITQTAGQVSLIPTSPAPAGSNNIYVLKVVAGSTDLHIGSCILTCNVA